MLVFNGMPVTHADAYRNGSPDAYGKAPENRISDGDAPCRCCLKMIPKGEKMLVLAYRPFETLQPYAETGPVFICAANCRPAADNRPPSCLVSREYLLKGYSPDERIVYGTGLISPLAEVSSCAAEVLDRPDVEFVDIRSARNNCWQARITREV